MRGCAAEVPSKDPHLRALAIFCLFYSIVYIYIYIYIVFLSGGWGFRVRGALGFAFLGAKDLKFGVSRFRRSLGWFRV